MRSRLKALADHLCDQQVLPERDQVWALNSVAEILGWDDPCLCGEQAMVVDQEPYLWLEPLVQQAADEGLIDDASWAKEQLTSRILGAMTPAPSVIEQTFWEKHAQSPESATQWLFDLQGDVGYIRRDRMALNQQWSVRSEWGDLVITVNLSKPEKDPKSIAAAAKAKSSSYPQCVLCPENEGFAGSVKAAPRHCLRTVAMSLQHETWHFQFSPYGYYDQHGILLCSQHRPMKVEAATFQRLFEFLELFPHYFVGSNADLPLVGGSILNHDHYQCGQAHFPIEKAKVVQSFTVDGVIFEQLHWPLSTLRLRCENPDKLVKWGSQITQLWRCYDDEKAGIRSFTDIVPHNTITPLARRNGGIYELDLVFRNNRTDDQFPDGIFCPHREVHLVKKENIGLIEVMGLAILPPRVLDLIEEFSQALVKGEPEPSNYEELGRTWYDELSQIGYQTIEQARDCMRTAVGERFALGLKHCGVFDDQRAWSAWTNHILKGGSK